MQHKLHVYELYILQWNLLSVPIKCVLIRKLVVLILEYVH